MSKKHETPDVFIEARPVELRTILTGGIHLNAADPHDRHIANRMAQGWVEGWVPHSVVGASKTRQRASQTV